MYFPAPAKRTPGLTLAGWRGSLRFMSEGDDWKKQNEEELRRRHKIEQEQVEHGVMSILGFLLFLALGGGLIYVVWHFITKYW
jgi:hypothetical protein